MQLQTISKHDMLHGSALWPCKAPGGCALRSTAEGHVCLTASQKSCQVPACLAAGILVVVWDECGRLEKGTHIRLFSSLGSLPFLFGVVIVSSLPAACRQLHCPLPGSAALSGYSFLKVSGFQDSQQPVACPCCPPLLGLEEGHSQAWHTTCPLQLPAAHDLSLVARAKLLQRVSANKLQLQNGAEGCKQSMHLPRFVEGCSVLMHGHEMGFSSQALRQAWCRIAVRVSAHPAAECGSVL